MKHEMINKEFFDSGISIGNRMNRRRFATISDNLNKRANKSFLSSESSLLRSNGFELNFCICKKLHAYQLQLTTQTFKSFFFLALIKYIIILIILFIGIRTLNSNHIRTTARNEMYTERRIRHEKSWVAMELT